MSFTKNLDTDKFVHDVPKKPHTIVPCYGVKLIGGYLLIDTIFLLDYGEKLLFL